MGKPPSPLEGENTMKRRATIRMRPSNIVMIALLLICYVVESSMADENAEPTAASDLRLPMGISPTSYHLRVKTWLPGYVPIPAEKNLTFDAQVLIKLRIEKPTNKIVLNAKNLNIEQKDIHVIMNDLVAITSLTHQPEYEKITIEIARSMNVGDDVELLISYSGYINNNLGGLYQSKYTAADGTEKILAITHMQPADARQLLPCFDEPYWKAKWTVSIIHPKGTVAVSNGIEIRTEEWVYAGEIIRRSGTMSAIERVVGDGFMKTIFKEIPPMSSYILAMMVSEFEYLEKYTASGVRFRVWARPEEQNATRYALNAGVKALEHYEKMYNISFPLEKQDMIAVPDFGIGAMENWGMVTYRERAVLYHEKFYTSNQKIWLAKIVAHELSHMWFGNLVTLKWWDSTWLNEGFASLIEHIGTDVISDGDMKMKSKFVFDAQETAFIADSIANSHPLTLKIDKSTELTEAFSDISYAKGASVLNMIRALLGEKHFNKGINRYLTIHSYGSAEAEDLWAALNTAVPDDVTGPDGLKLDVAKFARQWTDQLGYPYLIVEQDDTLTVKITQKRYKSNPKAGDSEKYANPEYGFKWDVPVWYKVNDDETKMTWLKRNEPLYLPVYGTIVLNDGSHIFHRTLYDTYTWDRILDNLNNNHLMYSNLTRYRLVSDAFAMTAIGEMKYEQLFDLLEYFKEEEDYVPWTALERRFTDLLELFGSDERVEPLKKFYLNLMKVQFKNTDTVEISENYLNDTYMYENLQSLRVFSRTCDLDAELCDNQMESLWQGFVVEECKSDQKTSECVRLGAPLRARTYCYGVRTGDELTFNQMMSFYRRESVQVERNSLMASLACTTDRKLLKKLLYLTMNRSNGVFRFQDIATIFDSVAKNKIGKEFILGFLFENWEHIHKSFHSNYKLLSDVLYSFTSNIRTETQYGQLRNFFRTAPNASTYSILATALEDSKSRIDWIKTRLPEVAKIAEEHNAME